jgi:hypothetical protein
MISATRIVARSSSTHPEITMIRNAHRRFVKFAAAVCGAAVLAAPVASTAGERGKFQGLAVLTHVGFQQITTPEGHPGGAVMIGEMDGLVFNNARGAWLDKAHYQVMWKGDGAGTGECLKTFTMPDGKLFAKCAGKATATGWEGTIELLGGTGAYAGVKGRGTYRLTNVSERVMWDLLDWDWEKP